MKRKIIIDTDPGIDDAYAILAALQNPDLDVLGITCVCGNRGIDKVVANALKLTQLIHKDTPVFIGASTNLRNLRNNTMEPITADKVHGSDGMGNVQLPYDEHNLSTEKAWDFIINTVSRYPQEVEILALGPLTNLALAVEKNLSAMKLLKNIYTMGGGINRGNITKYAEYNYYFDDLAAQSVFAALQDDIAFYMIGLDATHSTRVDHNDLAFMRYEGGNVGQFISDITQVYGAMYYQNNGYLGAVIHDVVTYLYMIDPTIATNDITNAYIQVLVDDIHRGQTVIEPQRKGHTTIAMHCDRKKTNQQMIKALFPSKYERFMEVSAK
ncbi:MAG: nucleoside hydrolase [Erysipelotrichaceae bacterium]|nr:nucleoside hydrolase [Erysipelotrichaceae bacterium]